MRKNEWKTESPGPYITKERPYTPFFPIGYIHEASIERYKSRKTRKKFSKGP